MSLLRFPARPGRRIQSTCARCISSSARSHDGPASILDVLSRRSPNQSHPSNIKPKDSGKFSALKLARDTLPKTNPVTNAEIQESAKNNSYQKQIFRKWQAGDVYAPHDLSGVEQRKWKLGRKTPQSDAFDTLGINPINEYKNYTMMSEYMTEMGRIKHSNATGLRPVNQRKVAKAIRRAIGLGLMPSVHRHPLVLKKANNLRFV